jgi:nitrite reductase/ring-hydroxylating ferredoxin subunit
MPSARVGSRLTRVEVHGRQLLVGRMIGGGIVAVSPACPHRQLPMDGGLVLSGEIACPRHQYTYDARTGENLYPKKVFPAGRARDIEGVRTWVAREQEGWVWVRLADLQRCDTD